MTASRGARCAGPGREAAADRQEDQVRRADAVDRGDERDGDAGAELARVGEVLHHVDQAEHGAEDADRRRVAAGRLEHPRRRPPPALRASSISSSSIARSVVGWCRRWPAQRPLQERIGIRSASSSSASMPSLRARTAKRPISATCRRAAARRRRRMAQAGHRLLQIAHRKAEEHGAERAAEHDQRGRALQQRPQLPPSRPWPTRIRPMPTTAPTRIATSTRRASIRARLTPPSPGCWRGAAAPARRATAGTGALRSTNSSGVSRTSSFSPFIIEIIVSGWVSIQSDLIDVDDQRRPVQPGHRDHATPAQPADRSASAITCAERQERRVAGLLDQAAHELEILRGCRRSAAATAGALERRRRAAHREAIDRLADERRHVLAVVRRRRPARRPRAALRRGSPRRPRRRAGLPQRHSRRRRRARAAAAPGRRSRRTGCRRWRGSRTARSSRPARRRSGRARRRRGRGHGDAGGAGLRRPRLRPRARVVVATITSPTRAAWRRAMQCASSDRSPSGASTLPGRRLEPMRACRMTRAS